MAGFMAGFGPAFAQSFGAGIERKAQEKQDIFKLTYGQYLENMKGIKDKEEEDRKLVNQAKGLARQYANIGEEAWPSVYDMLAGGQTANDIVQQLQGGEFETSTPSPATADAPDVAPEPDAAGGAPEAAAPEGPGNIQEQMTTMTSEAGYQTGAPQQEENWLTKVFKGAGNGQKRRLQESIEQISELTGSSAEEVESVLAGNVTSSIERPDSSGIRFRPKSGLDFTKVSSPNEALVYLNIAKDKYRRNPSPSNLAELELAEENVKAMREWRLEEITADANAKARAEGNPMGFVLAKRFDPKTGEFLGSVAVRNEGGNWVDNKDNPVSLNEIQPWFEGEREAFLKLGGDLQKNAKDYNMKLSNTADMVNLARDMAQLVDDGPDVLAQKTSGLAGLAVDWLQEWNAFEGIIKGDGAIGPDGVNKLNSLDDKLDQMLSGKVQDLALRRQLLDAKKHIFGYRIGIAMGQEGRALAEKEREIFMKLADAGADPEKFKQNLANILYDQIGSLKSSSDDMNNYNTDLQGFTEGFGWAEPPYKPVQTWEEKVQRDRTLNEAYQYFGKYAKLDGAPTEEEPTQGIKVNEDGTAEVNVEGSRYVIKPKGQ